MAHKFKVKRAEVGLGFREIGKYQSYDEADQAYEHHMRSVSKTGGAVQLTVWQDGEYKPLSFYENEVITYNPEEIEL